MTIRTFRLTLTFAALFLFAAGAAADTRDKADQTKSRSAEAADSTLNTEWVLPPDQRSQTRHVLKVGDAEIPYVATAGALPVRITSDGPECRIFFISYASESEGDQRSRPLTFVFNGGPGASSAYLHLAALGPRRVAFEDDGDLPDPPGRLVDNDHTWFKFSDLVFVDPVGTGYSRCTRSDQQKKEDTDAKAWGVHEDLDALGEFIRLYLTRNNRWLAPKFLMGESYGGFRVVALSALLQSDYGISANGLVLVSPALEFGLLSGDEYSLLPWVVTIPSYAATARYHDKASGKISKAQEIRAALEKVERFGVQELLPALAEGDTAALYGRLASFIGLPEPQVARLRARVPPRLYVKELLRDERRLISLYDGSWTAIDPKPSSPLPPEEDPLLLRINALLTAALNSYMRMELQFETDIPYIVLNEEVSKKWNWRSGLESGQGFIGVAGNLKKSMSINKDLKVLMAHGVFDLVTPYFGSEIVARQMSLDPAVSANLTLKVYEGGHMFYTHTAARLHFFEDAGSFFRSAWHSDR